MDRVLKEERQYTLNLVKAIKKSGANVLLVQKSILRDAISDLAIHYLNKLKIMVIKGLKTFSFRSFMTKSFRYWANWRSFHLQDSWLPPRRVSWSLYAGIPC